MKILDVAQGSTAWAQARVGVVTASEIKALITPLWKIRTGEGVETYLYKKLSEKLLGYSVDTGGSWAMDQGSIVEKIALPWYNFTYDADARAVGFCVSDDGRIGCSPDALIGDHSGMEIKSPQPPAHLEYLVSGVVPPEYLPQVHFSMLVTGRPTWKFMSFSRQFPSLVIEVKREDQIQAKLRMALKEFFDRFDIEYAKIKKLMDAEAAVKTTAPDPDYDPHAVPKGRD